MLKASLRELVTSFIRIFRGRNLIWHALMIIITYVLVMSGADWHYFEATRSSLLQSVSIPAALIGFFVPIILPIVMYISGTIKKSDDLKRSAITVAHAVILGSIVSSLYKAFTGRMQPEFNTQLSYVDISHHFRFGFMHNGIFWGWPSSHTTIAFAMSVTLMYLYRKNKKILIVAALYALYIGLGVSVSIHWLSDFVAGAILGTIVAGATVAK